MKHEYKKVVFDIGNVLIRWDPENLYRKLIPDDTQRDWFLSTVCPMEWNLEQDRGRKWDEALKERIALYPEHEPLIRAYSDRWEEMLGGAIDETVELLQELRDKGIEVYAITNFSREKFDLALSIFPFLRESFLDTVVSADEKLLKPEAGIYERLLERNKLSPQELIFIDDSAANVEGARSVGMGALQFKSAAQVRKDLQSLGFPV
ncbi:HAD family hydrolase [Polycladidibacter hongkongensis]|uniref:HAD family hydrolase n=1 Tax=Polycladidibacter hongkongensis TaxID=1647556 RepID=UPI00082F44CC|nr:HAD family phosphatase [Pseudovibrio hongkongensis]